MALTSDSSRSNPRNGAGAYSRFGHKAMIKVAWRIDRQFGSVEDTLAWGEFDAVANVTPDRIHHPTTMRAIATGEHIFCEKPLATDATLAMEMAAAMEKSGKVGMVNFTYRNSPALQKGRQTVLAGEVGLQQRRGRTGQSATAAEFKPRQRSVAAYRLERYAKIMIADLRGRPPRLALSVGGARSALAVPPDANQTSPPALPSVLPRE